MREPSREDMMRFEIVFSPRKLDGRMIPLADIVSQSFSNFTVKEGKVVLKTARGNCDMVARLTEDLKKVFGFAFHLNGRLN